MNNLSNESDEEYMFFDKYLSWLLFSVLTHKCAYKVQNVESYFLNIFFINQTQDKVRHLLFKQKEHRVFLNYLYEFNFFIFFTFLTL